MAGALRKTMVYLGLAEDDDERYDGYDGYEDDDHAPARPAGATVAPREDAVDDRRAQVTPISRAVAPRQPVEVMAEITRITTIHPRTYNEAKTIGEHFRDGTPVIMNLSDMDDSDAKRLVDFAAGLVFGLHGAIERVTSKVFLLSPAGIEVAQEKQVRTAREQSFFNQS